MQGFSRGRLPSPFFFCSVAAIALAAGACWKPPAYDQSVSLKSLAAMRTAIAFYRLNFKSAPESMEKLVDSGYLEEVIELRLPRHRATRAVKYYPALEFRDTGGWGYVNNPKDRDFGALYIDCTHRDSGGRYWSWF